MAIIILVGQSNSGKSTLAENVTSKFPATHLNLDTMPLSTKNKSNFMKDTFSTYAELLKKEKKLYIIDVGAGFCIYPHSYAAFQGNEQFMITIKTDQQVLYKRYLAEYKNYPSIFNHDEPMTSSNFIKGLDQNYPRLIYDMSKHHFTTTHDKDADTNRLIKLIEEL